MANRILRDWTQSETVDLLTDGAERFFVRLIMKADDFGCYYANPKLLKAALFPLKDFYFDQLDKWKKECVNAGLVKSYTVDGKECHRLITGKGWRVATKVNVMQIFKVFLLGKADLTNEKSDVKKHFKNWLIREKLDTLTKICNEG
jgi:hypothetical protein